MKRDPALKDFRNFLYIVWKHLGLPEPDPVQYDMAYYFQHGPKHKILQAWRGAGKSWIVSAGVTWGLYWRPDLNILVVSGAGDRADEFTSFTQQLIYTIPILQPLLPAGNERWRKTHFDVAGAPPGHAPSVKAKGVFGQLAGNRANWIIPDDVETEKNSETQVQRDKLIRRCLEFEAILKPGGTPGWPDFIPETAITYLGTPQTEESAYNELVSRGYSRRIYPVEIPSEARRVAYGDELAPCISDLQGDPGDSVEPRRFPVSLLEERRARGRSWYELQFMLDTSLSDMGRYPLKLSDLVVLESDAELAPEKVIWASGPEQTLDLPNVGFRGDKYNRPMKMQGEWRPYTGCVMAIDPSGQGNDELSYAVVKFLNSQLFLVESGGFLGGYTDENLKTLSRKAAFHGANVALIESNFGDGMFTKLLAPHLREVGQIAIEEVRHHTMKEARIIDTLEPVMNQHRLIVSPRVILADLEAEPQYRLFYQMTRLTRTRGSLTHDDRLDALAMAVAYWVESMSMDQEAHIQSARAAEAKAIFESFDRRSALGKPTRKTLFDRSRGVAVFQKP